MTTIRQLIDHLTDLVDTEGVDEHTPVLVAIQPSYPLAVTLESIAVVRSFVSDGFSDDYEEDDDTADVVWLATGEHPTEGSPYAPQAAFEGAAIGGW